MTGRRVDGVLDKVTEESQELTGARDDAERREEFGDLLMVLVNLGAQARHRLGGRSAPGECQVRGAFRCTSSASPTSTTVQLKDLTFDQLDELWEGG